MKKNNISQFFKKFNRNWSYIRGEREGKSENLERKRFAKAVFFAYNNHNYLKIMDFTDYLLKFNAACMTAYSRAEETGVYNMEDYLPDDINQFLDFINSNLNASNEVVLKKWVVESCGVISNLNLSTPSKTNNQITSIINTGAHFIKALNSPEMLSIQATMAALGERKKLSQEIALVEPQVDAPTHSLKTKTKKI